MGAKKKKALLTTTGAVVAQTISRCRIGCRELDGTFMFLQICKKSLL